MRALARRPAHEGGGGVAVDQRIAPGAHLDAAAMKRFLQPSWHP
jgi:hypothetical protein